MSHALTGLPRGHVGAIVTFLEMNERPAPAPIPESPLRIERWPAVDPDRYRDLFRRVGGRWLWFSRLAMDDAELMAALGEVHVVIAPDGTEIGLVELDYREPAQCLIRFLGLVPAFAGLGHGPWLFAETLALAWRAGVSQVKVHTCSLDHPAALPAYLRAGFTAIGRALETFPDPRLAGLLPRDIAPQLPVVE